MVLDLAVIFFYMTPKTDDKNEANWILLKLKTFVHQRILSIQPTEWENIFVYMMLLSRIHDELLKTKNLEYLSPFKDGQIA